MSNGVFKHVNISPRHIQELHVSDILNVLRISSEITGKQLNRRTG